MSNKKIQILSAGQIYLRNDSPVWFFLEKHGDDLPVLSKKDFDAEILDVHWLLDGLKNLEETPVEDQDEERRDKHTLLSALAGALDREKICKGWRKFDLLYIYP